MFFVFKPFLLSKQQTKSHQNIEDEERQQVTAVWQKWRFSAS
jgi:hypothetical protein